MAACLTFYLFPYVQVKPEQNDMAEKEMICRQEIVTHGNYSVWWKLLRKKLLSALI